MPLLVFSDYPKVARVPLEVLRDATTLEVYRQHVALGIRAGQSTLFAFEFDGTISRSWEILEVRMNWGVFCTMPAERLCIGCGLKTCARTEESHPNQRA